MTKQYGLTVLGNIRVFRKDKEVQGSGKKKYNITDVWFNVSEQDDKGGWVNKSMNLIFKKDTPKPENNQVINIISAFPILTGSGNFQRIALFVQEWSEVENGN